ncbi:hypothetical protein RRG08_025084 [Elysia crispata]|uniref:Uncharacterized protein n=1 Tax=Elysia crispata TaxID=231223 RepID=A0AAE1DZD7_9GAST|nr:hypothetical protein RRG08_025084 [Elysia crispata]
MRVGNTDRRKQSPNLADLDFTIDLHITESHGVTTLSRAFSELQINLDVAVGMNRKKSLGCLENLNSFLNNWSDIAKKRSIRKSSVVPEKNEI